MTFWGVIFLATILMVAASTEGRHVASKAASSNKNRIVGGTIAGPNVAKFAVSIGTTGHLCTGSLIDRQWILTAAQCVEGLNANLLRVNYNTRDHSEGDRIGVAQVITHHDFRRESMENDIALLRTLGEVDFPTFEVAFLPPQDSTGNSSQPLLLVGWGIRPEEGNLSPLLRQVQLKQSQFEQCAEHYNTRELRLNSDHQFCAGPLDNVSQQKGFCQGDIGSPLYTEQNEIIWGLASFTIGCGEPNFPGVYTKVSHYVDWILEVTSNYPLPLQE